MCANMSDIRNEKDLLVLIFPQLRIICMCTLVLDWLSNNKNRFSDEVSILFKFISSYTANYLFYIAPLAFTNCFNRHS
jgi:hypothetical protein